MKRCCYSETVKGKYYLTKLILIFTLLTLLTSCSSTAKKTDANTGPSPVAENTADILSLVPPVVSPGKVLVVFFSQGVATHHVAEDLAKLTGGDLEEIVELKKREGFFGYMGAGKDATFKRATPIQKPIYNPLDYNVVFVCTPVWAWNLSPPVRSWLRVFQGKLPKTGFVTVSGDTKPDKIVRSMAEEGGIEPFVYAGFIQSDFLPENRESYTRKIILLVEPLR